MPARRSRSEADLIEAVRAADAEPVYREDLKRNPWAQADVTLAASRF